METTKPETQAKVCGASTLPSSYHVVRSLFSAVLFSQYTMFCYQEKKLQGVPEGKISHVKKKEQASQSDVAGMLELPGWGFKPARKDMPRVLMDQVGNMQKQMSSVNREMEILKMNQKEMIGIKTPAPEMKNDFDGFISNRAWLGREALGLKISQQKSPELKKQRE